MQFPAMMSQLFSHLISNLMIATTVQKENRQDSTSGEDLKQPFHHFMGLPQSGEFSEGIVPISEGYY